MRHIISYILNIILIPIYILLSVGLLWYLLPIIQQSSIGVIILGALSQTSLFFILIGSAVFAVILNIVNIFLMKNIKAKARNFFIHIHSWIIALTLIIVVVYGFIFVNPLIVESIEITMPKKIGIGVILTVLILFRTFSNKITGIINRKIQSYDTAKELNTVGRSSIIIVNTLKVFELMFPEMLTLLLLSLFVSWNISSYFIVILMACAIVFIGNIVADFITRNELNKIKEQEQNALVEKISNNLKGRQ